MKVECQNCAYGKTMTTEEFNAMFDGDVKAEGDIFVCALKYRQVINGKCREFRRRGSSI